MAMPSPGGYPRTPAASYSPSSTYAPSASYSPSTSLARGNPFLAAVQTTRSSPPPSSYLRLDANRRDREKQLSSALVAQISQSPYARATHRSSLSTLSSPAPLLSAFMSSAAGAASTGSQRLSLDRTGSSSFVAPPRSPGAAAGSAPSLSSGARNGTVQSLPGTYQRPGRVENKGATYLTYLVEERKQQHWNARRDAEEDKEEVSNLHLILLILTTSSPNPRLILT